MIRTKERERKERERQTAQETEESGAGVPGGKEKKARGVSFATTLFAWGRRRGSTAGEKKQKAEKIS